LYHGSSRLGWLDVVKDLLDKGAHTEMKRNERYSVQREGETLSSLTAASEGGFSDIVQLLIEKGADAKQEGCEDDAIQAAVGHVGIVRQLLQAGALITKTTWGSLSRRYDISDHEHLLIASLREC
jgi:ankyrin repeat protein